MRTRFTSHHRGGSSGPPVVLLHGFTDTWRTWELVHPDLERDHDVLAPTLAGHAGGPEITDVASVDVAIADNVERAMDAAGFETAHIVGNSLGGYVALHLASRGRARSVTALAPAGGWPDGDPSAAHTLAVFKRMQRDLALGSPFVRIGSRLRAGRRHATRQLTTNYRHIPRELIVHMVRGARACTIARTLIARPDDVIWHVDGDRISCPVQFVWGTEDRLLTYPAASASFRAWLPDAQWVELDGIGHCPQLDAPGDVTRIVREHIAIAEGVRRGS